MEALTITVNKLQKQLAELAFPKNICDEVKTLRIHANANEQYYRNWSVRIVGLNVPDYLVKSLGVDMSCMVQAYHKIIHPVLSKVLQQKQSLLATMAGGQGVESGEALGAHHLPAVVPPVFELLQNGHFIGRAVPNKDKSKADLPRAIIIRFSSRIYRNLFLQGKKKFMPTPSDAEVTSGVRYYTATPDLTKANFTFLKKLRSDPRVFAAWSIDNSILFKLQENGPVHKTLDVFTDVDILIKNIESGTGGDSRKESGTPINKNGARKSRSKKRRDSPSSSRERRSRGQTRTRGSNAPPNRPPTGRKSVSPLPNSKDAEISKFPSGFENVTPNE